MWRGSAECFHLISTEFKWLTRTVEAKPAQSTIQSGPFGGKHFLRLCAASVGVRAGGVRRVKRAPSFSARGRLSSLMSVIAILLAPSAWHDSKLRRPVQTMNLCMKLRIFYIILQELCIIEYRNAELWSAWMHDLSGRLSCNAYLAIAGPQVLISSPWKSYRLGGCWRAQRRLQLLDAANMHKCFV